MTYEQIIALTDKGFTADQIMKLSDMEADPAPEKPTGAEVENPATDPDGHTGPADPEKEIPPPSPDPFKEFRDSMNKMLSDIAAIKDAQQAGNIKEVIRTAPAAAPTAEDMLAEIIRPTLKER